MKHCREKIIDCLFGLLFCIGFLGLWAFFAAIIFAIVFAFSH